MHLLARQAVARLKRQGIALDPVEDFHDLIEIDRLARLAGRAANPVRASSIIFPGLRVESLFLRRLSIGALRFLQTEVMPRLADNDPFSVYAIAYAMAHASEPRERLWRHVGDPQGFDTAVLNWVNGLDLPFDRLKDAIDALLDADAEQARRLDYRTILCAVLRIPAQSADGEILAAAAAAGAAPRPAAQTAADEPGLARMIDDLVEHCGHNADYWLWVASEEEVAMHLAQMQAKAEEEVEQKVASGEYELRAPPSDAPWLKARLQLSKYVDALVAQKRPNAPPPASGHGPAPKPRT